MFPPGSMQLHILVLILSFTATFVVSQDVVTSLVSRRITEYLLPAAAETHEYARVPGTNLVLLSQMSNSQLVKIELDQTTEEPIAFKSFPMGLNINSGLHAVSPSVLYPGMM